MRIFDAYFHIINFDFPIIENQIFAPSDINVIGGEIVSGSFQGFDQAYLLKALKQMGPITIIDLLVLFLVN